MIYLRHLIVIDGRGGGAGGERWGGGKLDMLNKGLKRYYGLRY